MAKFLYYLVADDGNVTGTNDLDVAAAAHSSDSFVAVIHTEGYMLIDDPLTDSGINTEEIQESDIEPWDD